MLRIVRDKPCSSANRTITSTTKPSKRLWVIEDCGSAAQVLRFIREAGPNLRSLW